MARQDTHQAPGSTHEFSLRIPGIPELRGMSRNFLGDVIGFADFKGAHARALLDAACNAIDRIDRLIEEDGAEILPIDIRATVDEFRLQIEILEHGRMIDDGFGTAGLKPYEEIQWTQRGAEGSLLRFSHRRTHAEISTIAQVQERIHEKDLHEEELEAAQGGDGEYRIRLFKEADAFQIAQRVYATYGRTYFNNDMYYPDRIIARNRNGTIRSVVAETSDGAIVGHCALERPTSLPIAELGIAIVDHTHRGHGLLGRMEELLLEEAKKLELNALWALPVAWHPYSQRMNLKHGWHPCGIALGVFSPARLGTAQAARSSTRITAMMHMLPLDAARPITASVPERIAPIVNAIYEAQGRTVTIDTTPVPPGTAEATETNAHTLNTTLNWVNLAVIQAPRIQQDTLPRLEEAVAVMETHSSAEAISIDLPITDPACAWVGDALMERGFVLGGIGPRFLGEDALRLQKPIAPCQREGLAIEGELSNRIAEEALRALPPDQVPSHA